MRHSKKQTVPKEDLLLHEIQKTKLALETAYSNFQNSLDPDLIDCYIYEFNAAQKRYKFLLKQVKMLQNEKLA